MKSDSQLQADVFEELRTDRRLTPSDIGVSARDGVVTLFGRVDSLVKRSAAVQAAARVRGVRALADEIAVRLSSEQLRTDVDIAHDAVHALMWDTEVPDKTIKARVQDRWIWLVGEAEWQFQRAAAERAVLGIRGVKGVTNLVRLKRHPASPELRDQVEAALRRNARLAGRDIAVTIENGRILLDGTVRSWGERMAAEHAVWSRRGVTDVENRLAVTPL